MLASGTVKELRGALNLSPSIHVTLKEGSVSIEEAAVRAGGEVTSINQRHIVLSCSPLNKMKVLGAITSCGDSVMDIELFEPSLEDVFMGYAGAGEG